jgi:hypothetical protein
MTDVLVMQGRELTGNELDDIRKLLAEHPDWGRTRLSKELCRLWNWRNAQGRQKDMSCRLMLLKLERRGFLHLPRILRDRNYSLRTRHVVSVEHATAPIRCELRDLQPLSLSVIAQRSEDQLLFACLLNRYHYLGHHNAIGEKLGYLARDRQGRVLACALFGSAAWKCAARDMFIGWDRRKRERNLCLLTNNTRFLILPWVAVPHLASHLLGQFVGRIRCDWQKKYGHPVHALETFVDRDRFRGVCYRAANWMRLGSTTGRSRNDRNHCLRGSVKDVYLYPLVKNFRLELCA